jgi:hypothetical protein
MHLFLRSSFNLVFRVGVFLTLGGIATAQSYLQVSGYIHLSIDRGSGQIDGYGLTEVYTNDPYNPMIAYVTTTVTNASGTISGYAANNCGYDGCANIDVYSQVDAFGFTYPQHGDHTAWMDDESENGCFCQLEANTTTDVSLDVPAAPSVSLNGIDASNPNAVQVSYYVNGPELSSARFEYGGILQYTQVSGNLVTFIGLDQNYYPLGVYTAQMIGNLYGLEVPSPGCDIGVTAGVGPATSSNGFTLPTGGDGIAPQFTSVGHQVYDFTRSVSYCNGYYWPGDLLTRLDVSDGDIQLPSGPSGGVTIYLATETHDDPSSTDSMPPVTHETLPQQDKYFQSREADYSNK